MRIESLHATNFGGFKSLQLDFRPGLNVIAGVNGSGKSTVLRLLSTLLVRHIIKPKPMPASFRLSASDRYIGSRYSKLSFTISFEGNHQFGMIFRPESTNFITIPPHPSEREIEDVIDPRLSGKMAGDLPLVVSYSVDRAVRSAPLRIRIKHAFDRASTYRDVSAVSSTSFPIFFEWFRAREDFENEQKRDDPRYIDPLLTSVRNAIEAFLPGFTELRVRRQPLRMTVRKDGVALNILQLSDGEKCLLAMVGDLARRLALLNPHLTEPSTGPGVILIDELELHLHPGWQRLLVEKLPIVFPNCQFIVTTHSPNVLNHVPADKVTILCPENGEIKVREPNSAYGRDSASLFSELFDVPSRPDKVVEELSRLFSLIHEAKVDQARDLLNSLRNNIGEDPELLKAEYLLRFKEQGIN